MPPAGSGDGAWAEGQPADDGWGYYGQDCDGWGEEPWPGATALNEAPGWWPPAPGGSGAAEADLAGPASPVPPGPVEPGRAAARRRRTRWIIAACAVAAVLIAAVALLLGTHQLAGGPGPSPTPTDSASAPGPSAGGRGVTGPGNLTVAQVFPGGRLTADGLTFTMVASQVTMPCAPAAHGAFAAALSSAGCERVVRATFIDSGKKYAVTAGVAVLPSPASAKQVDIRKQFGPDIWFTGLNGTASSSAARITRSGGYGYDAVDGRYIVFAFATFSDGLSPTSRNANIGLLSSLSRAFTDSIQQDIASG